MAGKGGGAWKVAYADFVTAMMAFFLVMWLTAQNQDVKTSVADYFSDPLNSADGPDKKKSKRTGSTIDLRQTGTVPSERRAALGEGRRSYTAGGDYSPATKMVSDWLRLDKTMNDYWKKQAQDHLEEARWSPEVQQKRKTSKQVATEKLTTQLKEEFMRTLPAKTEGVYRNLVTEAAKDVNWREIAEDLVGP